MTDETSRRYEGWRVAIASGVGVFVSFASLLVYEARQPAVAV